MKDADRRPLKSRTTGWAGRLTRLLLKTPLSPNHISLLGVVFAAIGAWAFVQTTISPSPWWWLVAALGIQLRLLANMLDGLVAVEGGRGHPTGALYNELPDRAEDVLLLAGAGYAAGWPELGWITALLAVTCAYVRQVGGANGLPQDFSGPMAKPHRMAALTVGCLIAFACAAAHINDLLARVMPLTLLVIAVGTIVTIIRRSWRMHSLLSAQVP